MVQTLEKVERMEATIQRMKKIEPLFHKGGDSYEDPLIPSNDKVEAQSLSSSSYYESPVKFIDSLVGPVT